MNPEKLRTYYGLNKHMSGIYGSDWIVLIKSKNIQNLQKLYWNMPFWVGLPWILPCVFVPFIPCNLLTGEHIPLAQIHIYHTLSNMHIYIIIQYIYICMYIHHRPAGPLFHGPTNSPFWFLGMFRAPEIWNKPVPNGACVVRRDVWNKTHPILRRRVNHSYIIVQLVVNN